MLMEKVWAKINGNYEFIIGGAVDEVYDFLGGCPFDHYEVNETSGINKNGKKAYDIIDKANKNNYMISVSCCDNDTDYAKRNLVTDHAYTVIAAVTVTSRGRD